ncbi:ABC transporter permease [Treponema brennaborense]|nr:FtsX-like permease family protein [Treponema brennaborense]
MDDMKFNIVHNKMGVVRIRNPLYTKNERINPLSQYIPDTAHVVEKLESFPGITRAEPKIVTGAAVYQNEDTKTVSLLGIDFANSNYFKDKDMQILSGDLAPLTQQTAPLTQQTAPLTQQTAPPATQSNEKPKRRCVVTNHFARTFNLSAGDKFTIMTQTARNGTNGCTLTIQAVVHLSDGDYAGDFIFMDFGQASSLLRMNGNATEILVFTDNWQDIAETKKLAASLKESEDFSDLEIIPWVEGNSFLQFLEFTDQIYFIFALIFFVLSAIVIFNSSMLSVMERKKEIGSLLSLGMGGSTVVLLFLLETIITSVIATVFGSLTAAVLINITNKTGINLAQFSAFNSYEGFNIKMILYPNLTFGRYVEFALTGFLTAVIACILPARMALSVQPAEALRSEN